LVKVAEAVMKLNPVGSARLTEVVEESSVPLRIAVPVTGAPVSGNTVTVTVVPVGTWCPATCIVTGPVCVGKVISTPPDPPVGTAGAD
jgi:hypothetical protein